MQPFRMITPLFRIDHIFVNHHFVPQETHVIPSGFGSGHRPVVATLRFANR
jgi:endonuclease/exonuclease/phosphatase family metal-dependent hydrolase